MRNIHTTEYYLVLKMKEILPFTTTLINLRDIMIGEISQIQKTNTWYHLYVEYIVSSEKEREMVAAGAERRGKQKY